MKSKISRKVNDFLRNANLSNCPFNVAELVTGTNRAGFRIQAVGYRPTRSLRGVLCENEHGTTVIFYPLGDAFLELMTVGHEVGHLVLGHEKYSVHEALQMTTYDNSKEEHEAEMFARTLLHHRNQVALRSGRDRELPAALDDFLKHDVVNI